MPTPAPPVRPTAPRPSARAKQPAAAPRAPILTTPLRPDEAKRIAAVLKALLKD